ncbi:MAG: glycosyltransferase family 4 protein, partial [Candidatus Magasanikbacteria bacterium]
MKVCMINNLYPPYVRGGAEQVVAKTVQGLQKDGHHIVVITTAPNGGWKEMDQGTTIYRYKPKSVFFYTKAYKHSFFLRFIWHLVDMFHLGSARYVWKVLKEEKPDVVHTHNLMGLGFLIPFVIRRLGLRHIHTVHDVQLVEPSGIILKHKEKSWRYAGFPTKVYAIIMRILMGSPEVVISPSQFLLNFYRDKKFFKKSNCVLVRNPITFDIEAGTTEKKTGENFRFLYLGQVEGHKGVDFLVDSFLDLSRGSYQNCELHIVGDGSLLPAIEEKVGKHDKIALYGRVKRAELPPLFRRMDMMIVPSLCYENSPTVIFESFAFGLPVLASNIEGIAELIQEGENGLTFEAGDSVSLLEKIRWCLDHKPQIIGMKEKTTQS